MIHIRRRLYNGRSLHQCFQVIYFCLYHTGCLGFKLDNGITLYYTAWSCAYAYIVRFLLMVNFIGGFALKIIDEESYDAMIGSLTPVVKFILCFECLLTTLTYLEVTFFLDLSRRKHLEYAHNLQRLDNELKQDFPYVNFHYEKSSRKYNPMSFSIYIFFMVISIIYVFNMAHCRCGYISSIMISIAYACITGTPGLAMFLYVAGMDMIRLRFRLLRKLIKLNFINRDESQRSDTKDLKKFNLLVHYFKQYNYVIPNINSILGNVCASSIFHDFAIVTNMVFLMCTKAIEAKSKWYEYLIIFLFMSPRFYKIIIVNIYGFLTEREKNGCTQELIRLEKYFSKPLIIRDAMQSFLHWRMHNNHYFVVGRVLRCNFVLIILVLNSVVNYVIILIQLMFQQNAITTNLNRDLQDVEQITVNQ